MVANGDVIYFRINVGVLPLTYLTGYYLHYLLLRFNRSSIMISKQIRMNPGETPYKTTVRIKFDGYLTLQCKTEHRRPILLVAKPKVIKRTKNMDIDRKKIKI